VKSPIQAMLHTCLDEAKQPLPLWSNWSNMRSVREIPAPPAELDRHNINKGPSLMADELQVLLWEGAAAAQLTTTPQLLAVVRCCSLEQLALLGLRQVTIEGLEDAAAGDICNTAQLAYRSPPVCGTAG
jgi:hypothetical protein